MNMYRLVLSILSVGVLSVGLPAMAQQPAKKKPLLRAANDGLAGQGYGMAGCGLGSVVFGQEKGFMQVFAGTTNGTSLNQSFALSSGTSNCGDGSKLVKADQFIETNHVALENDMARGQGETLASLAEVLSCKNTSFFTDVQNKYSEAKTTRQALSHEELKSITLSSCKI